jgi:hypothetical protein
MSSQAGAGLDANRCCKLRIDPARSAVSGRLYNCSLVTAAVVSKEASRSFAMRMPQAVCHIQLNQQARDLAIASLVGSRWTDSQERTQRQEETPCNDAHCCLTGWSRSRRIREAGMHRVEWMLALHEYRASLKWMNW